MAYIPPNPNGQATSANSEPVVIASDQSTIPVSVSGVSTAANQSTELTQIGGVTETAPASDTASSGLNGRLQRIAQRLTSLIALLPTSLGQKTKANSLAVTLASDQDALPVTDNGGSLTVDGTVAATQSGTWTVQPGNTANTTAWKVDGSAVTQPVSGTVTANAGTNLNTSALALDATITGGTQKAIARGGAKGTTTAADVTSTASGANHNVLDVAVYDGSGNLKDPTQIRALTSSDQVTFANTSLAVTQATATNLKAQAESYQGGTAVGSANPLQVTLANTGANATAVKTDSSATTQPVSGTVSVTGVATATKQSDGSQKTQVVDGSGNVIGATANALDVNIKSGSSSGTQYANASAQATPTGTVSLGYDGANVRAVKTATDGTVKTVLSASQANVTGSITTSTSTVTASDLVGVGAVTVQIAGTYAGVNATFEASIDGTNWVPIYAMPVGTSNVITTTTGVLTTNSTNVWNISPVLGLSQFRVRATAYTSGTANVTMDLSAQFTQYASVVNGSQSSGTTLAAAPVTTGGQAKTTNPTAVTDGQVVNATFDKLGKQVIVLNGVRDLVTQNVVTLTGSTTETTLLTSGGAGVLHDLTYLKLTNSSATTGTLVTIRDATAGTAVDYWYVPAGQTIGGVLQVPFKQTTANNNWTIQCGTSVSSLYATVQAVKNI